MELTDLQSTWREIDRRLTALETDADPRPPFRPRGLIVEPVLELVASGLAVLFAGGFLADNWANVVAAPAGALPALTLYAFAVPTIWLSVRRLTIAKGIDPAASVVDATKRLAELERLVVRATAVALAAGTALWIVFPMLLAQWLAGYRAVFWFSPAYVAANVAFGVVLGMAGLLVAKRLAPESRFIQGLRAVLAGSAIARARRELEAIETFEED